MSTQSFKHSAPTSHIRQNLAFRLFISSTFDEFQPEREYLRQVVFPRIALFCQQRGGVFQTIDLRSQRLAPSAFLLARDTRHTADITG